MPRWSTVAPVVALLVIHSACLGAEEPGAVPLASTPLAPATPAPALPALPPVPASAPVSEDEIPALPQALPQAKATLTPDLTPIPTPPPRPAPSMVEILAEVMKATVRVKGPLGEGSGMIIDTLGYVLTANHVVQGQGRVTVRHPSGRDEQGIVLGRDEIRDLAIVKISGNSALPTVRLGDLEGIEVGDRLIAIGYPGFNETITTTGGVVSAVLPQEVYDFALLQTDAAFYPGLSGGPLITSTGEVVGLITGSPSLNAGYATGIDGRTPSLLDRLKAGELILEEAKPGLGHSRRNPAPLNHTVRVVGPSLFGEAPSVHDITITQVIRGNEAYELLGQAYAFNPEPYQGQEYVLALVHIRYISGPTGETDWVHQVDFRLLSGRGTLMDYPHSVLPLDPFLSMRMYPGAVFQGWTTWAVNKNDKTPLMVWGLDWYNRSEAFFSLAEIPAVTEDSEALSSTSQADIASGQY